MSKATGTYRYIPRGVCSSGMEIRLEDGVVADLRIESGCSGNLQGIAGLAKGRPAAEIIERLRGIRCGHKSTSCPDQLSVALTEALEKLSGGGPHDE